MYSSTGSGWETVLAVYDEYDAVCAKMAALNYQTLSLPELLELQSRREHQVRCAPAVDHVILAEMQSRTTAAEIGAKSWSDVLAIRLRISNKEAKRRVAEAANLGPRTTITGQHLAPVLPATAAAQAEGHINTEHVAIIRKFFAKPPVPLDVATHAQIDADLARIAAGNSPEILKQCADRIGFLLNQDGDAPIDEQPERHGEIIIGPQNADGTSEIRGRLTLRPAPPSNRSCPATVPPACATRRRAPLHHRHSQCGGDRGRHPQRRPAQPRRPGGDRPQRAVVRRTRSAQRITGHDRGIHHAA